ncbi:hypothetical protein [Sigmofec virus UA08Rod_4343]|uniref:Uncharacterized protein n=1 Tax=Sigmofec virus UA08Rod_4343 TaxID=2929400 RepID=A0A976N1R9_9VIRU|nr:hypothetical protein [Sigmofec virus UA08Rod_4343]
MSDADLSSTEEVISKYNGLLSDCKVLHNMYYDVEITKLKECFDKCHKIFKNIYERNLIGRNVVPKSVFEYLSITEGMQKYPYNFYHFKFGKRELFIEKVRQSYAVHAVNYQFDYDKEVKRYVRLGALTDRFNLVVFPCKNFSDYSSNNGWNKASGAYSAAIDFWCYSIRLMFNLTTGFLDIY